MNFSGLEFIQQKFIPIVCVALAIIFVLVLGYRFANQTALDTQDYSLDVNIEDNFVLPPQAGEKYFHFSPDNQFTIINYFSLDCPYCRKLFFEEKNLVEKFGDKVNFAFRDKPLSSNPLSYEKALLKECVYLKNSNSEQKYFQFTEDIFKNYQDSKTNDWAKQIALKYISDTDLADCLSDPNLKQKILHFRAQADASQIFWTPTIVLFKDGVEVERIEKVWIDIYKKVLEKYTSTSWTEN